MKCHKKFEKHFLYESIGTGSFDKIDDIDI